MPQIKIRGIDFNDVCKISQQMVNQLEKIVGCSRNDFTIECLQSTYVMNGKIVKGYPFIEVAWFDRGQNVQDRVAQSITKLVQQVGYPDVDVIFTVLDKNKYYENGEHF
jgi:hypothetical protein